MQAGSSHVHGNILRICYFKLPPFPVLEVATDIIVCFKIAERQVFPIYRVHISKFLVCVSGRNTL